MKVSKEEFVKLSREFAKKKRLEHGPCDDYTLGCYASHAEDAAEGSFSELMEMGLILVDREKVKERLDKLIDEDGFLRQSPSLRVEQANILQLSSNLGDLTEIELLKELLEESSS